MISSRKGAVRGATRKLTSRFDGCKAFGRRRTSSVTKSELNPLLNHLLLPCRSSGLINSLSYFEVSKGSDIVVEGEDGFDVSLLLFFPLTQESYSLSFSLRTSFYILIKGEVNVIKQGIGVVATLPGGTSFGELDSNIF